jgi:uncharacterized phage protein gp47/JayE
MSGTVAVSLQNFDTLVQNEAAAAQAASSQPLNFDTGSVLLALVEASSGQALWLQYLALLVLGVARLATSTGTDCDSFGADFGFTRLSAVAATGQVTFSRYSSGQAAFIPIYVPPGAPGNLGSGAQVLTSDGTQTFDVTADPTNSHYVAGPPAGYNVPIGLSSITLPIVADVAGTGGNVLAGTISLIVGGISGIDSVTNSNATSGGLNSESDAAFRTRFVNYINSRSQATDFAIGYAIQSVQQGLTYSIQENTNTVGAYTPGTDVVTVDDGSGSPPPSLISTVNLAVQAIRPIGSTVVVQGPTKVSANISCILAIATGATLSIIESEVNAALTAYVNAIPVGTTLPYNKLAQVIFNADANITNVSGLTLNGSTADLTVTESQVIRVGTISVT